MHHGVAGRRTGVSGAAYGTTDMGLNLDNKVAVSRRRSPSHCPLLKDNGGAVALPDQLLPPQPFAVQVTVYVVVRIAGISVTICVQ